MTSSEVWWPQDRIWPQEQIWPFSQIFDLKWSLMTSRPNLTSRANLTFFQDFRPQVNSDAPWPNISGNCRQERHLFIFHLPSSIERKFRPFLKSKASFWFKFLLAFAEFEIWTHMALKLKIDFWLRSHLMTPGPFFERLSSRASFWYRIV